MFCSNERMAGVGVNRVRANTREYLYPKGSAGAGLTGRRGVSAERQFLFAPPPVRVDLHDALENQFRSTNKHLEIKESIMTIKSTVFINAKPTQFSMHGTK